MKSAIIGIMFVALLSGFSGLFIGYNVANNHFQQTRIRMIALQNQALAAKDAHLQQLNDRNAQLTKEFMDRLDSLADSYEVYSVKMQQELKQAIYSQCKLPKTGRDLLKGHIKEANQK